MFSIYFRRTNMRKSNFSDCDMLFDGTMMYGMMGWCEYIKRKGDNTWEVWYDPLDDEYAELYEESEHNISSLITYVKERDIWLEADNLEEVPGIPLTEEEQEYCNQRNPGGTIGPHMNGLLEHLVKHGTEGELLMAKIAAEIVGFKANEIANSDLIGMKILNVSSKAIWRGVYKKAFEISSYYGHGKIYPPDGDGIALLFLYESNPFCDNYQPNFVRFSERSWKELKQAQRKSVSSSLIFHIPHASRIIPVEYQNQFLLSTMELVAEHLRLVDRYADELFDPSGYPRVISSVSRFVCDVERFSDDEKEPMAKIGMGAVYRMTTDGRPLRREITKEERNRLIEMYHRRNERDVENAVCEAKRSNGFALIIDCHTFPSIPLTCDEDRSIPRPDICIGTDENQTSPEVMEFITQYFTKLGYSILLNSPYVGTYIPDAYKVSKMKTDFARKGVEGVQSIMIEVNRALYMDEESGEKLPQFEQLQQMFRELWSSLEESLAVQGGYAE
jgi:N-formylglutamate deformylase